MSDSMRVYVNASPVDVPAGSTALDAVRSWNAAAADAVAAGDRMLTDSRGLPAASHSPAFAGAIFRVVAIRARADDESPL
jgi:hypothetical protein